MLKYRPGLIRQCRMLKHFQIINVPDFSPVQILKGKRSLLKLQVRERNIIDKTLITVVLPISLLPIISCCRPLILFQTDRNAIANVVVLIPPPVEPGDAPIHIRIIITKTVGYPQSEISVILKPAVLALTLPKNEIINFRLLSIPFRLVSILEIIIQYCSGQD